jgi:phosphatidate cytidylyltransferase
MDLFRYWALVATVLGLLGVATWVGQWLRRQESSRVDRRAVEAYNARIQAWWFFGVVLGLAIVWQDITVILFGMLSFWALREFVTLTPTRPGDHRALSTPATTGSTAY